MRHALSSLLIAGLFLVNAATAVDSAPLAPYDANASATRYMTFLYTDPPKGPIEMAELRLILEQGLAKYCAKNEPESKEELADRIMSTIRLIVGDGPFLGDPAKLTQSIERNADRWLTCRTRPIDTTLTTFLALSFCDVSTREDHEFLAAQFHELCLQTQAEIHARVAERGLDSVITPEYVESVFRQREELFRAYVEDPLYPMFKFPWTTGEQADLVNKGQQSAISLKPSFMLRNTDLRAIDSFLWVSYSPALLRRGCEEVATSALIESSRIRRPVHGAYGFGFSARDGLTISVGTSVPPMYGESSRARRTFLAMKYFHLGRRLEEVAAQEEEIERQRMGAASQN
jgi:hypothetical protein